MFETGVGRLETRMQNPTSCTHAADLHLLDFGHYQSLCRIHGNTDVVICPVSDGSAFRINSAVQNRVPVESHGDCLYDDWHVRELNVPSLL